MSNLSLRAYNQEIEGMIEHSQFDEAIAHCLHILQSVPKHISTYRLLGKALLEEHRYADAADIFHRVLSSIPDDFVANIGMSIIKENENKPDLAIWHMERAFESQPANNVVQSELRRLYGKRDGIEPAKIRMTRGALARMYAKGHLYRQAIGELRAALTEDPQRLDLQVLLAEMYFRNGQDVEAVNSANSVLRKLPYCLEANRILASILPKTERKEDAAAYRQRIISLDPYYGKIDGNNFNVEKVPDSAIQIERLTFQPGQNLLPSSTQPDWVSSLGMAFDSSQDTEKLPDWLAGDQTHKIEAAKERLNASAESTSEPTAEETPGWVRTAESSVKVDEVQPEKTAEIPDFLRDLGWEPATKNTDQLAVIEQEETGTLAQAEIPDWLKEMAPQAEETEPSIISDTSGEVVPWLQEKQPGGSDTIANWLESKPVESKPEDLEDLANALKLASSEEQPGLNVSTEKKEETELPTWLKDIEGETVETDRSAPAEELPAWSFEQSEPAAQETLVGQMEPAAAEATAAAALPAEEIPDWLKGLGEEPVDTQPSAPAEELPAWSFEQSEPAVQETLVGQVEPAAAEAAAAALPAEEIPDWLKGLGEEPVDTQPSAPAEELPAWSFEQSEPAAQETLVGQVEPAAAEAAAAAALPAEEIPDWLKDLSKEVQPAEQAVILEPLTEESHVITETHGAQEPVSLETPHTMEEPAIIQPSEPAGAAGINFDDPDAAMAWLESLAAHQGVPEDQLSTKPDERPTTPDWLIQAGAQAQERGELSTYVPTETTMPAAAGLTTEALPIQDQHPITEQSEEAQPMQSETAPSKVGIEPDVIVESALPSSAQPESEITRLEVAAEAAPVDELPDWLKSLDAEVSTEPAATPAWLSGIEIPPTPTEEDTKPTRITQPVETVGLEPAEETIPEWIQPEPEETAPTITPETPTWIQEQQPEELPAWIVQPEEQMREEEELPAWLQGKPAVRLDLNTASLKDLEDLPGVGFILAQKILTYRELNDGFQNLEELANVPGIDDQHFIALKDYLEVRAGPTILPASPSVPTPGAADSAIFDEARRDILKGETKMAGGKLTNLIQRQLFLPEIIQVLQQALVNKPDDVYVLQSLGDAHLNSDNLQAALDAYLKAEELLR